MAYDDHIQEVYQQMKKLEVAEELILRRARFRDDHDELLKRYDNALFTIRDEQKVIMFEKAIKQLVE